MMKHHKSTSNKLLFLLLTFLTASCTTRQTLPPVNIYHDKPYIQDYSIKYNLPVEGTYLYRVESDRNGYIQVLSSSGLMRPSGGQFLYPGLLVEDLQYRPTSDKKIKEIGKYKEQLVYIDEKSIFSNAWAGSLFLKYNLPGASLFCCGNDFTFLITDGREIILINNTGIIWKGEYPGQIREVKFDSQNNLYWILGEKELSVFDPSGFKIRRIKSDIDITCFEISSGRLIAGTKGGYFEIDTRTKKQIGDTNSRLPSAELTVIREIDGNLWFGSLNGAFKLRNDEKFDYYASQRWLPSDDVIDISKGPDNSILILTGKGLAKISFNEITLSDKAVFFDAQVRERHIRNGFNATLSGIVNGDVSSGSLEDSDNDGLWTSMYLAGQAFRYKVTGDEEALQNVRESLDALERLYIITGIPGFPARSFERRGYKYNDKAWQRAADPEWDWKSTTSSDEAIGHMFAFGVIADLVSIPDVREKAIMLIDILMSNIIKNNLYLIDWDGLPTTWGKWNPDYVNTMPEMVGDRKLNSSNIIAMLQTAYHFTGKEKYRKSALSLMEDHGYLKNLMRPMRLIGSASDNADELSRSLSDAWNHSDDEMYFCGYWGLYRYALNDTLKKMYKSAIIDHWQSEKPEKDALWNILTAMTGIADPGLEDAIWYLHQYPLDLIDWSITNSSRKDIDKITPGYRNQTLKEVLPPDELPVSRHNANRFIIDSKGEGRSEYSAGDIWLLPYWAGRYLGVISGPEVSP